MAQIYLSDAPERLRKGTGRYPQQVALLARLGVHLSSPEASGIVATAPGVQPTDGRSSKASSARGLVGAFQLG